MFGTSNPKMLDIEIGYGESVQVTWGRIEFALLEGKIDLGIGQHPDYGDTFRLTITCPKKYASSVDGLRKMIEHEIETNSIYKGKAIRITSGDRPRFIDLQIDKSIVYNDDVMDRLDRAVWAPLRHTELLRNDPESKVDGRTLLFGPYGTGKSECGRLTARRAVDNGWTFISYDSGKGTQDDLRKALQTAKLFAPAVVFVEDVDIYAEASDSGHTRSRLLEMFDGISSKGHEILVVMTSNKAEKLDKGMIRPGRIDHMIEIGNLDRKASEKLIKLVNGDQLAADVDFDAIYKAVSHFEPAFLRSTFTEARTAALIRTADALVAKGTYTERRAHEFKLTTSDFITAAHVMEAQHERHSQASDSSPKITIDDLITHAQAVALATHVRMDIDESPINVSVLEAGERPELITAS
jgi:transitional endoplasmic reticulum ATPase